MNPHVASFLATSCVIGIFCLLTVLAREQRKTRGMAHQDTVKDLERVEQFWHERVEPQPMPAGTVVTEAAFSSQLLNLETALHRDPVAAPEMVEEMARVRSSSSARF